MAHVVVFISLAAALLLIVDVVLAVSLEEALVLHEGLIKHQGNLVCWLAIFGFDHVVLCGACRTWCLLLGATGIVVLTFARLLVAVEWRH